MATAQDTLNALLAQLMRGGYRQKDDEALLEEARAGTASAYDQKRLSARERYEQQALALAKQLSALAESYDARRAQSDSDYRAAYGQADRDALKRGMQRSSYTAQTLAGLLRGAAESREKISGEQAAQERAVREEQSLAERQLARQLEAYDNQQMNDTQAALNTLREREYQRANDAQNQQNQLALQLYRYQHELESEAQAQQNWLMQYAAKYGATGRGGGGRSGGSQANGGAEKSGRTVKRHYPAQG